MADQIDPRIADFIREHRGEYTREALIQQLLDAGYARGAIDATWAALDTPDPDSTAEGGFWGRWFLILIGINVAVLLLVGLATGAIFAAERIGLLGILAVALAIGGLIAWGLVAATGPGRMGRTTATVIGVTIPLVIALILGGTCYALIGALGPPPRTGTFVLEVEAPSVLGGSGVATCYLDQVGGGFSVFGQREATPYVTVSIDTFPIDGGQVSGEVTNVSISVEPTGATERGETYSNYTGRAELQSEVQRGGLEGTVTFTGLPSDLSGPEVEGPDSEPISGSVSWSCE